jgi:hypothetical protein
MRKVEKTECVQLSRTIVVVGFGAAIACGAIVYGISGPYGESDSRVQRVYDPGTTRLRVLMVDTAGRGKVDTWYYMDDHDRLVRMEVDRDGDGVIDRWEYFDPDGKLQKIGFSTRNDGHVDAWRYRGPDGQLVKIEYSAGRDGIVTSTEYYDHGARTRVDRTVIDGAPAR